MCEHAHIGVELHKEEVCEHAHIGGEGVWISYVGGGAS